MIQHLEKPKTNSNGDSLYSPKFVWPLGIEEGQSIKVTPNG